MRNTSEFPEGNEQATPTPTPTRNKPAARSKPESATTGSQDQQAKPPTRRRTTPPSANAGTAGTSVASAASVATTSMAATTPTQEGRERTSAPRRAPAPRPASTSQAEAAPARPAGTPRNSAATTTQAPRTNSSGSGTSQAPRTNNSGSGTTQAPRTNNSGSGTAPAQRQAYQPHTPQPQRSNGNGATHTQFQRGTGATAQRPAARPGAGNNQATGVRPGGPARPNTARPGSQARPTNRPGSRPAGPAHRTQERRAALTKEKPTGPISIPPQIVVKDLADLLHTTPNEVIRGLIKNGVFASINQVVDYEKAAQVAEELGFQPSMSALTSAPSVQSAGGLSANEMMMASRNEDNMIEIPPVVTIMGHVDHGKTSLLDMIRKTKVAAGEAGGITQHIGAYQVEVNGKKITFLDTPGHEAFTAMRARGAQVTHIAIIVVAADDGVMPQTREAIDHARAAKVPIIIALNKIDKANANPDHVKQQLAEIGLLIEEYGGDIVCVPVSARRGTGIDELLEMILLVAELQDIKANPNRLATGVIIEARLEKNTGPTATVLIQQGTLKMGDNIVVGSLSGKVRAMFNDRGKRIQKAPPSTPVSILGLPEVPNAGDHLEVMADEKTAKQAATRIAEERRSEGQTLGQISLDTLYMQEGNVKELNIVLKCDVQGSAEAIKNALSKLGEENLKVRLIHEGIGNISETDVHLAAASGAVIIGFNVKADGAAQRQAQKEGVDIRYYNIIYKLTDDLSAALTGMLEPTYREVIDGHAEVMQTFKAGKNIVIAGCRVTDGKIVRSSQARITRKNEKVFDGKIASLRRGKDDVREVSGGYECGIVFEDYTDFEVGDIIEAYSQERVTPGSAR
jgi:translation initiation factor IF-2